MGNIQYENIYNGNTLANRFVITSRSNGQHWYMQWSSGSQINVIMTMRCLLMLTTASIDRCIELAVVRST